MTQQYVQTIHWFLVQATPGLINMWSTTETTESIMVCSPVNGVINHYVIVTDNKGCICNDLIIETFVTCTSYGEKFVDNSIFHKRELVLSRLLKGIYFINIRSQDFLKSEKLAVI